jgi:iron(III) transport system substrate-binding protein
MDDKRDSETSTDDNLKGNEMTRIMKALMCGAAFAALALPAMAQEEFSLDAVIEAARAEPPINVYDSTGKIVAMAENFAAAYGLQANGVKARAAELLEMVIREVQAGNVQTGVVLIADVPAAIGQLLPEGFADSWLPPDQAEDIDRPQPAARRGEPLCLCL